MVKILGQRGGACLNMTALLPPDPPKVLVPIFMPFEILGKRVGTPGTKRFFIAHGLGSKCFSTEQ